MGLKSCPRVDLWNGVVSRAADAAGVQRICKRAPAVAGAMT